MFNLKKTVSIALQVILNIGTCLAHNWVNDAFSNTGMCWLKCPPPPAVDVFAPTAVLKCSPPSSFDVFPPTAVLKCPPPPQQF